MHLGQHQCAGIGGAFGTGHLAAEVCHRRNLRLHRCRARDGAAIAVGEARPAEGRLAVCGLNGCVLQDPVGVLEHHHGRGVHAFEAVLVHPARMDVPLARGQGTEVGERRAHLLAVGNALEFRIHGRHDAVGHGTGLGLEGPACLGQAQHLARGRHLGRRQQGHGLHFGHVRVHHCALSLMQGDVGVLPGVGVVHHAFQHFGAVLVHGLVRAGHTELGAPHADDGGGGLDLQGLGALHQLVGSSFQGPLHQLERAGKPVGHLAGHAALGGLVVAALGNIGHRMRQHLDAGAVGQLDHGRAARIGGDAGILVEVDPRTGGLAIDLHSAGGLDETRGFGAELEHGQRNAHRAAHRERFVRIELVVLGHFLPLGAAELEGAADRSGTVTGPHRVLNGGSGRNGGACRTSGPGGGRTGQAAGCHDQGAHRAQA